MVATFVRAEQIKSDSLMNLQINSAAAIALSKLAEAVIQADGGQAFTADQSMGGFVLSNLGNGVAGTDAVNMNQLSAAVTGLLEDKGGIDCSASPNYPAASKGDAYRVTVAGKIGGASGITVEIGDLVVASADNAGGTQAAVGSSWYILESNISGLSPNGLSLITAANYAAMRALLDLEAGTDFYSITAADAAFQPKDATLTALAGLTIAANSLSIGTGADAFSQITFAANTFPARASTGDLVAKSITDFGLSLVDDADAAAGRTTLGGTTVGQAVFTVTNPSAIRFLRVNADNSVTLLSDSDFRTAIGAAGGTLASRETPSGTVNGSNTDFVLAATPASGSEQVYLNGILQDAGGGNDYTIATATITFATAPQTGDKIRVTYWT